MITTVHLEKIKKIELYKSSILGKGYDQMKFAKLLKRRYN